MIAGNSGDEDSIASVRSAKGRCRKAVPLRMEPALGQASEYLAKEFSSLESKEVCHVLHDDVARSNEANDSEHLAPKCSLGMVEAGPSTGARDALAGEAANDDIDSIGRCELSDVSVDARSGPAEGENLSALCLPFAEPAVPEAGKAEAVVKESDAREERANGHAPGSLPPFEALVIGRLRWPYRNREGADWRCA